MAVLIGNHAHQADGRPLSQRHHVVPTNRLRATRHDINAQLGRRIEKFERLRQMKQSIGAKHGSVFASTRFGFVQTPQEDKTFRHIVRA